jgi:hypothetical protein
MSEVEFEQSEESKKFFSQIHADTNQSVMGNFLIKNKLAKDIKQANIILLGVCAVFLTLMFIVFSQSVFSGSVAQKSTNSPSMKTIKSYIDQGLNGQALLDKINQDKALNSTK